VIRGPSLMQGADLQGVEESWDRRRRTGPASREGRSTDSAPSGPQELTEAMVGTKAGRFHIKKIGEAVSSTRHRTRDVQLFTATTRFCDRCARHGRQQMMCRTEGRTQQVQNVCRSTSPTSTSARIAALTLTPTPKGLGGA